MAYGLQHGFNRLELGFFSPTLAGFLGVTPLLLFSFLGFESGNSAAGEMKNPAKDVPSRMTTSGQPGGVPQFTFEAIALATLGCILALGLVGYAAARRSATQWRP